MMFSYLYPQKHILQWKSCTARLLAMILSLSKCCLLIIRVLGEQGTEGVIPNPGQGKCNVCQENYCFA